YDPWLWRTDATPSGTYTVKHFDGSGPENFVAMRGRVYFVAGTIANGRELFSTDGTANGTRMVVDLTPENGSGPVIGSNPANFKRVGSGLFFTADTPITGRRMLCVTDGTATGTHTSLLIANSFDQLTATRSLLFF